MKFFELALYLEKLEKVSSRNEMTVILAELFTKSEPNEARLIAYLSQGKLGPAYRSPDFGVADKMIIKALGEDAGKLFKQKGDLGLVAMMLAEERGREEIPQRGPNIEEVYEKLMVIAETGGEGSQERKQQLIADLISKCEPLSAKYTVRMILGKLRAGFSDMTILDALSWMVKGDKSLRTKIEGMYNVRADLGEIAEIVCSGKKIVSLEPKLGTPILMARAERAKSPEEIWERNGECAVEHKLDGLRIQAHMRGGRVELFSRGLENVTSMYPDVVAGLAKQINTDCIVEGEMIAVGEDGKYLPFQETVQRKRKYNIAEMANKVPLKIFLFDILMREGGVFMQMANEKRRLRLEETVKVAKKRSENVAYLIPRKIAKSIEDIQLFFEEALDEGTEGIVAKKLDGVYQAGSRDFNWIKYKKSYDKSALKDTVDAVVMGYDLGQGKRSDFGIGDFLIGVYDKDREMYATIAKVGTGLTDEEWKKIKREIDLIKTEKKPIDYDVRKEMFVDVWAKPKIVVEIRADEITKSPMHTSGYALRFPRLVNFRDKTSVDATSAGEILRLFDLQQK